MRMLLKTFTSPGSATSGLAGYSLEGQPQRRTPRKIRQAQLRATMQQAGATIAKVDISRPSTDNTVHRDAATSPFNLKPQPSQARLRAGNYPKGHIRIAGLDIAIENPAGSKRRPEWPEMKSHYGYIKRTEGADGDQVDCFVHNGTPRDYRGPIWVINQYVNGKFDEHKVMIGWYTEDAARKGYLDNYEPGWAGLNSIKQYSVQSFKEWLRTEDTTVVAKRVSLGALLKGDTEGHDFHGNQWTTGAGGAENKDGAWHRNGAPLSQEEHARMSALGVPPAWTGVKLNPDTKAALQVIGKDSKGRTQRIYSAEHSERAAAEKFARLKDFNNIAPKVEGRAREDMNNKSLPESTRDAAAATYLISQSGIRVGSDRETGGTVKAYGATTLEGRHVSVDGNKVQLEFVGKKGVNISKTVDDAHLARFISDKKLEPGTRVFGTSDSKVRDYFHAQAGDAFKVKDFRTLVGTRAAIDAIKAMPAPTNAKEYQKYRMGAGRAAAAALGNTPAIALAAYVDPSVFGSHITAFAKSDAGDMGDYFDTNRYDKTPSDWRDTSETDYDPDDESVPERRDGARLQAVTPT